MRFVLSMLMLVLAMAVNAQIPSNGLVAWYPFNGNANDESGNGNDGVVNGATLATGRQGNISSSYDFDFGHYIDCGSLPSLGENPSNFSISVWLNAGNIVSSDYYVVGTKRHIENGMTDWVTVGVGQNKFWMRFDDSGYMESNDLFSVSDALNGTWSHVVYIREDNVISVYVNGVLEGTAIDNHILTGSTYNFFLGGHLAWNKFFLGKMDDVAIYNRVLNSSEIQQLYQDQTGQVQQQLTCNIIAPTTTLCAGESVNLSISATGGAGSPAQLPANLQQGLVAYYPFNGNANDESGNGNNGTVNGATLTSDRYGNVGRAYSFDGVNDWISANRNNMNEFTISFWANLSAYNCYGAFIDAYNANWEFLMDCPAGAELSQGSGNVEFVPWSGTGYSEISVGYVIPLNEWKNLTLAYQANSIKVFVNGALINTINNVVFNSTNGLYNFGASISGAPQFLSGSLDDISIFNRLLSPSEIQQLYTAQSFTWNTGATTNTITVSPTSNTTYSCTVTQGNQTCTASIDITVNPAVARAISASIIEGESYTLGTQTLTTAGTYIEVFTSAAGCDSTVTLTLAVEPLLTCNITAATTTLCSGESVDLTVSNTEATQLLGGVAIGDQGPGGGIIYFDKGQETDGWRYLEALPYDLIPAQYGCNGTVLNDAGGEAIGSGLINTLSIVEQCADLNIAAKLCMDLVFGGKDDWFLPSRLELYELYLMRNFVGGFVANENYWTSTQQPVPWPLPDYAYFQGFQDTLVCCNGWYNTGKDAVLQVRPIRYVSESELVSYVWSTGATTNTITVTPTTNTTYSCAVTSGSQTCTASIDINVNPTVTNDISATIIEGESYILGTQTLTTAGTYIENFTSNSGCDSIVALNLSVIPLLTCEITSNSTSICSGEELTLNISSNVDDILAVGESTFNGQGYIQFPNTGLTGSTSRTITYKAKTTSQNIMSVLNYGGAAGNGTGLVELGMNLDMWFGAGSGYCDSITKGVSFFSNSHSVNIGKTVFDNQWHTITYVMGENNNFAFSSIKVYVDGILVSQGQNNTPFCGHNWGGWQYNTIDGPLTIGKPSAFNPYASKFVGSIADVAMWSRALSSSEVLSLNAQSPNIISNGLAHYYPLTGGTPLDLVTGATGQVLGLSTSNINWSTGATSASIIVNPTSNTSYSCTVNAGPQTCTASIDITVSPQQTFYADADGDGYGNPQVVVTNCNQPAGYVTDNTDCNDNDAAVYVASTETCNGLDDNCDGQVDEGLTLGSVTATSVTTALYPTCSGNALKSANLNNGINSPIIDGNGLDLWYSLTAQYNTLRAGLSAAFGDNEIRLYSYNSGCFELMETEHEVYTASTAATGNQVLITDDLLVGQTYYIAVHNISGPMNSSAKMCFNHFVGTTCDHYYSNYTGVYNNVCTSFKAQYKGNATNYIFDILSATQNNVNLNITPWSYTTTTANSVVPRLGTIFPVNMSNAAKVYTLRIPVIYEIPDAAGNYTSITANATTTCTVTLNAELPIALRAADRCPNTKTTTSSISVDRTICGAQRYEWEFTQQLPSVQSPVTVLGGLNTTVFFLNNVPGMGTGKTYNVRVRPIHANGEVGNWGTAQCLKTGTSGMVMQSESGVWANNYSSRQAVTLYPNPTSTGHFTLMTSSTEEEVKQIVITDITGKMVFQSQVVMNGNAVEVEFGDLATGMYLVMVGEERLRLVVE